MLLKSKHWNIGSDYWVICFCSLYSIAQWCCFVNVSEFNVIFGELHWSVSMWCEISWMLCRCITETAFKRFHTTSILISDHCITAVVCHAGEMKIMNTLH